MIPSKRGPKVRVYGNGSVIVDGIEFGRVEQGEGVAYWYPPEGQVASSHHSERPDRLEAVSPRDLRDKVLWQWLNPDAAAASW